VVSLAPIPGRGVSCTPMRFTWIRRGNDAARQNTLNKNTHTRGAKRSLRATNIPRYAILRTKGEDHGTKAHASTARF
jgi:hypothetical protein